MYLLTAMMYSATGSTSVTKLLRDWPSNDVNSVAELSWQVDLGLLNASQLELEEGAAGLIDNGSMPVTEKHTGEQPKVSTKELLTLVLIPIGLVGKL